MAHIVQFLTFEALEMTHTCCHFEVLDRNTLECVTSDDGRPAYMEVNKFNALVIVDCDTVAVQETRADEVEQRNAVLLDSLVEEFGRQLRRTEATRRTLEDFLHGFWRRRIEGLFAVDEDIVNGMKERLDDVKTYVWPERVLDFVRFDLQEPEDSCTDAESICDTERDTRDVDRFESESESEENEEESGDDQGR
ncbi:hypothetical protein N0V84_010126 [Fusarium piperis]|uniref:Uncharacterized protein n=1 Tax=Fusarium piperis TaxID=1435070 RepID=A0A9W9BGZ8_9HYPO|nr:hypothetical protein N0V84_010126 [Fusarium piperis]